MDPSPATAELRARLADSTFHRAFGLVIVEADRGTVALGWEARPEHLNLQGLVHGGALATLLDTAMGLAVRTALEPGRRHVTIEMGVHYLRPAHPGPLRASGRCVRAGREIAFAEAEVLDAEDRVLARATGTFSVGHERD
jgi:uncharacterized protein (TIGR00369 family)